MPPRVAEPLTASTSNCPAVLPASSTATDPPAPCVRFPLIDSVPTDPAPPGWIVPSFVSVFPAPTSIVPAPRSVPVLVNPADFRKVAPEAISMVPVCVNPLLAESVPELTFTVPVLLNATSIVCVAALPAFLFSVPALLKLLLVEVVLKLIGKVLEPLYCTTPPARLLNTVAVTPAPPKFSALVPPIVTVPALSQVLSTRLVLP